MADTIQGIRWALEQSCQLRTGQAVHDISAAAGAVYVAHSFGRSLAEPDERFGIFGDVVVTGVTGATLPERLLPGHQSFLDRLLHGKTKTSLPCSDYPTSGYIISEKFKHLGGSAGLHAMCAQCPANTQRPFPAGCTGYIFHSPWCKQTQKQLESIISSLGLDAAVAETFVPTSPIWFGLWTRTLVSPKAAGLLETILTTLAPPRGDDTDEWLSQSRRKEFETFIAAAKIAQAGTVTLRVQMSPPGHTDFGTYTVFPHCPLCKAEADVKRWQREYPTATYACKVCGTSYSPAEQSSSKDYESDFGPDLREILGTDQFRKFVNSYLVARDLSPSDAAEIIELTEADEVRRKKIVEKKENPAG